MKLDLAEYSEIIKYILIVIARIIRCELTRCFSLHNRPRHPVHEVDMTSSASRNHSIWLCSMSWDAVGSITSLS